MKIFRNAILFLCLLTGAASAEPFAYQGQLQDEGVPANGTYDFVFRLYTTSTGTTQVGPASILNDQIVTDGQFLVEPDFGPGAFDGSDRYLAIFVRDGDSISSYTPLLPRSKISASPMAQHAKTADTITNPVWTQAPGITTYGDGNDKAFINRSAPLFASEYFGVHNTTPGLVGMIISGPTGASPYYGYSENGLLNAYTYHDSASNQWRLFKNGLALSVDTNHDLTVENDVIANSVIADDFLYPQPKTHYYSVSGNSFVSGSLSPYYAAFNQGGAYINIRISGWLVAPVNLPDDAVITKLTAYAADTAAGSMSVTLYGNTHGADTATIVAAVDTSGATGSALTLSTTMITNPQVSNINKHYYLRVFSSAWPGDSTRRIKSVVIEYTTTQAD